MHPLCWHFLQPSDLQRDLDLVKKRIQSVLGNWLRCLNHLAKGRNQQNVLAYSASRNSFMRRAKNEGRLLTCKLHGHQRVLVSCKCWWFIAIYWVQAEDPAPKAQGLRHGKQNYLAPTWVCTATFIYVMTVDRVYTHFACERCILLWNFKESIDVELPPSL